MLGSQVPFEAIADFTYDWESWIDKAGRLRWVNPAVVRLTGFTAEECFELANYPLDLVHPEDRPALARLLERAARGESANHHEFRVVQKDGSIRWGAMSFQALVGPSGEFRGYRTSVRDIEQQKRMERALVQALERAEAADQAKTAFLASVSHELRTPLQSILGYGELLLNQGLPAHVEGYARTVLEQSRHLERLVQDLLDYSTLRAGRLSLRFEPYDPERLLREAERALWPLAERKRLRLEFSVVGSLPPLVVGDRKRVLQVITNLTGNAIKFTASGAVVVTAKFDPETEVLEVTVDDSGPGIEDGEAVFEPFRRGAGIDQDGVGLGLAISRQLCRQLGGDVVLGESPLSGARLVATFAAPRATDGVEPGSDAPPILLGAAAAPSAGSHGAGEAIRSPGPPPDGALSVVVIDDVAPARGYVEDALESLGHVVRGAASAGEGISLTATSRPDLVLVDIQMPAVDGWDAVRELRELLGRGPFLVALTATDLSTAADRVERAGFDAFAQKPIDLGGLRALVQLATLRRDLVARASVFDPGRWQELAAVRTADGRSLLERTGLRVEAALGPLAEGIERSSGEELARLAHEARGLAGLIGARELARLAELVESDAAAKAATRDLVVAIDATRRALGRELAAPEGPAP